MISETRRGETAPNDLPKQSLPAFTTRGLTKVYGEGPAAEVHREGGKKKSVRKGSCS